MTYTKEYEESMKKYINLLAEKENKTMSNKELLGKSFAETLKEGTENFANWANAMSIILNKRNKLELENNLDTLKEFDSALTDMKKVSEETVKAATEKER